jgi:putative transposase
VAATAVEPGALRRDAAPEVLVSDSGSVFKAQQAQAIYAALGIQKAVIEQGQPWQNYIETHFNVMRRMADHHYAQATSWSDLQAAHDGFFHDYNHQPHFAHDDRPKGRRSPAAVLGWVHGMWCDPADLDHLFRLRATRVLSIGGSVRFRHWRLYGERGLAGEQAAVWVWDDELTIAYASETLARYRVVFEAEGRCLREVGEPQLFVTGHAAPQPFLTPLDETEWHPAQRLAPYRARRRRSEDGRQERLFAPEDEVSVG